MKRKINNRLIGTAALAIVATLLLTAAVCYSVFKDQVMDDLRMDAGIISRLAMGGEEFVSEDLTEWLKDENIRITLVDKDGNVLYDSKVPGNKMENHRERPEIHSAFVNGEGSEIRRSDTLDQNTYYYAVRTKDGNVLRVAEDVDSIYSIMEKAVPCLVLVAAVLLAICCVFSHFLAQGLIRPIELIGQDVENVGKVQGYEELQPFIEAVRSQHEDVVQSVRLRQAFTANVSHELKTPLTAISGYAELIQNDMASSDAEVKRFAGEIHDNAGRLLTLIDDVIRLSQLDAEDNQEQLVPVNLKEIAETCVEMLQINAEKFQIELTFRGEDVVIMATRQMAEEVLYNLCDNAIRYNKAGGTVQVEVRNRLNTALLMVKDTGIGIPVEHQERIFERFYRVDRSRSKATGGTGLGLAIVKHILFKISGELTLKSEPGLGTQICISFPAVRKMQPED